MFKRSREAFDGIAEHTQRMAALAEPLVAHSVESAVPPNGAVTVKHLDTHPPQAEGEAGDSQPVPTTDA